MGPQNGCSGRTTRRVLHETFKSNTSVTDWAGPTHRRSGVVYGMVVVPFGLGKDFQGVRRDPTEEDLLPWEPTPGRTRNCDPSPCQGVRVKSRIEKETRRPHGNPREIPPTDAFHVLGWWFKDRRDGRSPARVDPSPRASTSLDGSSVRKGGL